MCSLWDLAQCLDAVFVFNYHVPGVVLREQRISWFTLITALIQHHPYSEVQRG